jgi:electron transport complex protein RnfB
MDFGPDISNQKAFIVEDECIGCKKCIDACPVDAIHGAANLMHSVIDDLCTGCELCVPPCPVDCIELVQVNENDSLTARNNSE